MDRALGSSSLKQKILGNLHFLSTVPSWCKNGCLSCSCNWFRGVLPWLCVDVWQELAHLAASHANPRDPNDALLLQRSLSLDLTPKHPEKHIALLAEDLVDEKNPQSKKYQKAGDAA